MAWYTDQSKIDRQLMTGGGGRRWKLLIDEAFARGRNGRQRRKLLVDKASACGGQRKKLYLVPFGSYRTYLGLEHRCGPVSNLGSI